MPHPNVPPLTPQNVKQTKVSVPAPGDWTLAATLFQPDAPQEPRSPSDNKSPVVLISTAAGVPAGYYKHFAIHLVEAGASAVVTYDYRGFAASAGDRKRWPELTMQQWGFLDMPAMIEWMRQNFPNRPLVGLGHSVGGQILGLSGQSAQFERYTTVATMSGHWRLIDTPWSVWLKTQIVGRAIAHMCPSIPKGLVSSVPFPSTIFREWADWVKWPNYFFDDPEMDAKALYEAVQIPILSIRLADDKWGTHRAIGNLMSRYKNSNLRHMSLKPGKSGPIGHIGYFRKSHRDHHWPTATDFLLHGKWPVEAQKF